MRHMLSLKPRRLARTGSALAAVGLTLVAAVWVAQAARTQHMAAARAARADRLETVLDLVRRERALVTANRIRPSAARARQIDASSASLLHTLRAWDSGGDVAGLSTHYGDRKSTRLNSSH